MSDDSEEDYAQFGTPLDPLDEDDCPRKKPCSIEEQFARDKHGRRRFHGAFTGGFSAGFLNTVGSLEGWRPSFFKSSKTDKASAVVQRPEQFMDEEDIGEFGIAPSVLHAKADFSGSKAIKRKHSEFVDRSVIEMSVLKTLLQPVRETVGAKLLRQMGWKPGQGIGPRVSKYEKKRTSKLRQKSYGCLPPRAAGMGSDDNDDDGDGDYEDCENVTFAPDDYLPFAITPKDNLFGIGYKGLEKRSVLSAPQAESDGLVRTRKTISGQAFGVGAFEEEDEDIYYKEDMSQYDFSLENNPAKDEEYASRRSSGEDLFDLFVLALKKTIKKVFLPPALPKDFKAIHRNKVSRFEPAPSEAGKQRLASPERNDTTETNENAQREASKFSTTSSSTAGADNFKPFIYDSDKQTRYEKYLELVAVGKKDALSTLQPITMTEWEKEGERIEFEQATKIFRPLSGIMEDRFTRAQQPDDLHDPLASVEKLGFGSEEEMKAAKMNMFGQLTRVTEVWKPSTILCKRFNIPELNLNEIPIVSKKSKPKYSIFDNLPSMKPEVKREFEESVEEEPQEPPSPFRNNEEEAEGSEPKKNVQEMDITDPKKKVDLFNAIFLDSGSEDEDTKEGLMAPKNSDAAATKSQSNPFETTYEETVRNEKRNMSPPRGIFENIDYDLLDRGWDPGKQEKRQTVIERLDDSVNSDMVYGPKIPDKIAVPEKNVYYAPEISDDCWVEKSEKNNHKKKNKKSKKSKHKAKHKHKKSKR